MSASAPLQRTGLAASLAALLLAILTLPHPTGAFAQDFPELTGRVTDAASIIPDDVEARLTQNLEALEQQSQRQLVVATIPSLEGYEISDYGYRLGREWGIGDKERNDGTLLIIAPNERKVRIEVGYGLEPVLTDGLSWQIVNNDILPRFKQSDMPGGIEAGVDAIVTQLTLPEEEAIRLASEANQAPEEEISFVAIIFMLFFLFFFVWPVVAAIFGFKAMRHGSGARTWSSGGGSSWGGGGFSGGGGSFGGGGSSGSW
jgi:uncharacterized protein